MNVQGRHYRTIWEDPPGRVRIIDQRALPHRFVIEELATVEQAAEAIRAMHVRGAGLIGATAAYGIALAANASTERAALARAGDLLKATRPTAVNLAWAVDRQLARITAAPAEAARNVAWEEARLIADEDAAFCRRIGEHGLELFRGIAARKPPGEPIRVLTHCNAGWLAFVDFGSATAPIYAAHDAGIPVEVWVDETRPRNQGSSLTAWELGRHGVPHRIIVDNAGGHLMQHGLVDLVITGADRVTRTGDAANKIGTYLKALAARDNNVPFYVALPSSTFDWTMRDGVKEIPIEEREESEVLEVEGWCAATGGVERVRPAPEGSRAGNYGFDVTPARLITGLITERGVCAANEDTIGRLFPEAAG